MAVGGLLSAGELRLRGRTCRPEHSVLWLKRVAAMLRAGVPAARAVRVAGEGSVRALREASEEIARGLEAGVQLDRLLSGHPGEFPPYVAGMVAAGYAHGRLDAALLAAAEQMQWDCELKRKVVAVLLYPSATLLVLLGVAMVVTFIAVPSFEQLYRATGAQLPVLTRGLVGFSRVLREVWWVLVVLAAAAVSLARDRLSDAVGRLLLRIPFLRDVLRGVRTARVLRVMARLYASGIVLTRCLEIASESVRDADMSRRLLSAARMVSGGMSLSRALSASGGFDPHAVEMIRAGEESGSLDACMLEAASHIEEEADHTARVALSVMEPVSAVLVGLVALVCALALYLPVFDIPGLVMRR